MKRLCLTCVPAVVVALAAPASGVSVVTLGLDSPVFIGGTAEIDVSADFAGGPGDTLDFFDLSVTDSSASLAGRFAFELEASLPGWRELDPLADDGVGTYESNVLDPSTALPPGAYRLGTLRVDLAGLPAGAVYTIVPDGALWPTVFFGTDGQTLGLAIYDTAGGGLELSPPGGVELAVPTAAYIPEPLTLAALPAGLLVLSQYVRRRTWSRMPTT
jgi:hypothetical protein